MILRESTVDSVKLLHDEYCETNKIGHTKRMCFGPCSTIKVMSSAKSHTCSVIVQQTNKCGQLFHEEFSDSITTFQTSGICCSTLLASHNSLILSQCK